MRYLFLLWGDEAAELALTESERRAIVAAHGAFLRGLVAAGRSVTGEPLGPARDGVIVGQRRPSPTDGAVPRDQGRSAGSTSSSARIATTRSRSPGRSRRAPGWRSRFG
jgi:hypothetical protein